MNKKILILYTSIGLGHKIIAENIGFYLKAAGFQVELHDEHKVQEGFLVNWAAKLYALLISQLPFIWGWLYNTKWFISLTLPFRLSVAGRNYQATLQVIKELKPDLVISTHNTASGVVAYLKQKNLYQGAFAIAFSDFHLHRFWLYEQADFYLANIEEQKQEMLKLGVRGEKIFVCGITLKPKVIDGHEFESDFAKASSDTPQFNLASKAMEDIKKRIRNKFEIEPGAKVVLISSGSQGTGVDENLINQLLVQKGVKVIVVCGKNKKLYENLENRFAGSQAVILGYYSPMDELYAIANIFITKPGGLSVSEALQWKLPILISHMLPGGEMHNYSFLSEKGLIMPEPINIVSETLEELETGGFKKALEGNPNLPKLFNGREVLISAVSKAVSPEA